MDSVLRTYFSDLGEGRYAALATVYPHDTVSFSGAEKTGNTSSLNFVFSEVEESGKRELNALVEAVVTLETQENGTIPTWSFSGRLNLHSLSSREGYVRQLMKATTKKIPADTAFSEAITKLVAHIRTRDESVWFEDIEGTTPEKPLFDPLIIENAPNLLFGKGGTGKTYLCLRIALSLATGKPMLGMAPTRACKTLFVDYESSKGEFFDRFNKLIGGMGKDVDLHEIMGKVRYFPPLGRPLHEIVPLLKKTIREHGIEFVLVDSAILACGAEPEKADVAARYFNALASLGVTTLTIAHETKAENHAYPFGSIVWWNSPRNIWNAQGVNEEADEDADPEPNRPIEVGLFHRKANNGSRARMIATKVTFTDGSVGVGFGDVSHWDKEVSISTRILRVLRTKGMASRRDIDEELEGIEKNTIKVTLRRLVDTGKVERMGGQGGDYCLKKGKKTGEVRR